METKTTPSQEPVWKTEVREHFESQKVGIHQAASLEALLLATPEDPGMAPPFSYRHPSLEGPVRVGASSSPRPEAAPGPANTFVPHRAPASSSPHLLARAARRAHASGFGYVAAVLLAASATFFVQREWGPGGTFGDDTFDPIADLANQPGPRSYPADFDLEGDPAGFREIVQEVFPHQDVFSADLGKQLAGGGYTPSEGRFFTWSGEPGVSILLKGEQGGDTTPATLYIVRLTDKNEQKFPRERTLKRVTGRSGKVRKVNVWRDGRYGYAMVQSVALSE